MWHISFSRWILQGTSNVLLVFDESEVRKIIAECKKVLDYLSVAEVIETMDDLVQFVRDLSPCLSKVRQMVRPPNVLTVYTWFFYSPAG
jgi:vinculin